MASMGICCGVKTPSGIVLDPSPVRSNQISRSNRFLSIPNSGIRNPFSQRVSASIALSDISCYSPLFKDLESGNGLVNIENSQEKEAIFPDNLDGWMRDSVVEIVKNLKKAPLLVHVYSKNSGGGLMEVKTEKGVAENWPTMKKEWREGERKSPDGIILVEELEDNKDLDLEIEEEEDERETKAWGVLIQGKGAERECRPSCYLLKTCRVNSGLGFFGTHFSLVKVNSFRESAFSQIKNSWLLQ